MRINADPDPQPCMPFYADTACISTVTQVSSASDPDSGVFYRVYPDPDPNSESSFSSRYRGLIKDFKFKITAK